MDYLNKLQKELIPWYTPPRVSAGHDWHHCDRMAQWGLRILGIAGLPEQGRLAFDIPAFVTACWLHNLDRVSGTHSLDEAMFGLLAGSPFDQPTRATIIEAVDQHSKFMDEPTDSHLLTALRIADKLDRIANPMMGIIVASAFQGTTRLMYDSHRPFGYASTAEAQLKSIYNDLMRQLEWYAMLPSDDARDLVPRSSLRFYADAVRQFAAEIVRHTGVPNEVEHDLAKAFGNHYPLVIREA